MATCLVIGANGFLGSYLVDELAHLGHTVTAFDRFSSGLTSFASANASIIAGDFLNQADLEQCLVGQDYVFHFLSTTTPATVEQEPRLDIRTNVTQTLDLLDMAVAAGTQRIYFASSGGAVYGDQGKPDYSESDPLLPVSPYGIGKTTIENYLRYYRAQHGLQSLVLRISNPYGMRQHPNRRQGLIPIAVANVLAGLPVQRYGDGGMIRDYAFVQDVVRMIGKTVGRQTRYDTYNIGSGTGHSVNEVFTCIRKVTGIDFDIESFDAPVTFVQRSVLNTDRFRREFGFTELTPLEAGIEHIWSNMLEESAIAGPAALPPLQLAP
ncbi:MAG: hypothetical protein JWL94_1509 [Microbacteriaceae bacterium]|jgi:UDP-glucose 4-epimerase|nr:hypothetical protein [Microbacteriaceae bacterium]HEV7956899.1 NAD-dependent epimerase/dehydratase family protein [Marisediminicola sp.]